MGGAASEGARAGAAEWWRAGMSGSQRGARSESRPTVEATGTNECERSVDGSQAGGAVRLVWPVSGYFARYKWRAVAREAIDGVPCGRRGFSRCIAMANGAGEWGTWHLGAGLTGLEARELG
eukprot:1226543-Prymnesium_polylepis.1